MEECKFSEDGLLPLSTLDNNHIINIGNFIERLEDIYNYAVAHNVTNIDYSYPFEDDTSLTLLELAVDFGSIAVIQILLSWGVDPNLQDEDGMTPLHFAILHNKSVEVIKCLLDNGADPNIQNRMGVSALYLLVQRYGVEEVVRVFYLSSLQSFA